MSEPREPTLAEQMRRREEQWRRFHAWEEQQLASQPVDEKAAFAWMWDAWQLAKKYHPDWSGPEIPHEHVQEIMELRRALAVIKSIP